MMYDGYGWWGGMMGFGFFGMILFWVLVVAGVVALVRLLFGWGPRGLPPAPRGQTALDVLAERYARGEIDRAEFEQKRRDLSALS